ncbi:COX15/CtaA family protein [Pelagibacterales bacterium SAG-MED29]|nr:COX15/CtaA family protein [Pelagibacterales bacterium SAG-MED29]
MNINLNHKLNKFFLNWLILLILLIGLMIIVGGLTRLTDSGLSITQWELFSGVIPPITEKDWIYYFNLYKEIPEYKLQNYSMNINEFKVIFWWEWIHRILGRIIGLAIILPLIFFSFKINYKKIINLYIIFLLVCFQGFMGWYMVASGLVDKIDVSHFRLSAHLFIAFIILASLTWNYLNFKTNSNKSFFLNNSKFISIKVFLFLIFLQIILGAFVSGLDAGKIYQTWPLMNESFYPNDINFKDYKEFLNLNDRSVVQFIHRNVAYIIFFLLIFIGFSIKKFNRKNLYKPYFYLLIFIFIQIILGILALITDLHIAIASLHQISSIFLILLSLNFYYKSIN